jgi:asparagine synthase (glutamine-hydrolysing)
MCGIFALYRLGKSAPLSPELGRMSAALRHRGPDDTAFSWLGPGLSPARLPLGAPEPDSARGFLGHHRLSIIDLSEAANQPFIDSPSGLALSFNGEIYNYVELREELRSLGARFRTASDTEVVLEVFKNWGPEGFTRLNGDFAFLIHDAKADALWGCRDRFGVKPFFFRVADGEAAFASELKALPGPRRLNERLAYRYLAADFPDPAAMEESFVEGARSVKAGHWFRLSLKDLSLEQKPYWTLEEGSLPAVSADADENAERLRAVLEDAVRIRTRADVPLGAFLSGGLDSSSIVALAAKVKPGLPTFSSTFPGSDVDEGPAVSSLAAYLKVPNHATPSGPDGLLAELEELVRVQDQPFMTLNVWSQYQNLRAAKRGGLKVVLDGGGGDEALGGYADYLGPAAEDAGAAPVPLKQEGRVVPWISRAWRERFGRGGQDRPVPSNHGGRFAGSRLKHALRESLLGAWMNKSLSWDDRYLDLSGMALGIEARVPFQDHRLVELALALPSAQLIDGKVTKAVLRRAMRGHLPEETLGQTRKIGFEFPFCELYARDRAFRAVFEGLRPDAARLPGVDGPALHAALDAIAAGRSSDYNVWRPFNLLLWQRASGLN